MKCMAPLLAFILAMAAIISLPGCVGETQSCEARYTFIVKAYDAEGKDAGDSVESVIVYIFDRQGRFVREIETAVNSSVSLPAQDPVSIVTWGNIGGGRQARPEFSKGDLIGDATVNLNLLGLYAGQYIVYDTPDDLFHGAISLTPADAGTMKELPIYRSTGSLNIRIWNLKEFSGKVDDRFSIVVRETCDRLDFTGEPAGERIAAYRPNGSFRTNESQREEYFVPAFCLIPDGSISIDIYYEGTKLATVSRQNMEPISIEPGMMRNVLIDLSSGSIEVNAALTPWGKYQIWKNYN